jgi:2-polyprenyl-3-methyl-5-hydroxy-6-metoxy-1,4-benzoquinol methylase
MPYSEILRKRFHDINLEIEDLYLLESFQIGNLVERAPKRELAAVLWAHPSINRFFVKRHPPIANFINTIQKEYSPVTNEEELTDYADELLWDIADLIIYNKNPEVFDARAQLESWVFNEITSIVSLENKVIIDAGAGTGKIAFQAARTAKIVFAVEPVSSLRRFIQKKAATKGIRNVYAIDGFLHAIPFPDDFVDVLLTCKAIGWKLEEELKEIERVVKPGGFVVHVPMYQGIDDPLYTTLTSFAWQYECSEFERGGSYSRKYWKKV